VDVNPFRGFAFDKVAVDDNLYGGDAGKEARKLGAGGLRTRKWKATIRLNQLLLSHFNS
jgi:hypothetical protein